MSESLNLQMQLFTTKENDLLLTVCCRVDIGVNDNDFHMPVYTPCFMVMSPDYS